MFIVQVSENCQIGQKPIYKLFSLHLTIVDIKLKTYFVFSSY